MNRKAWIVLCLGLLAVPAAAGQLMPQDFAFGADFSGGQSSLRQATLPAEVLERIQHPDFADVRVFNADGVSVPFEITSFADKETLPAKQTLSFFLLDKEKTASSADIKLELRQEAGGQHLQMSTSSQERGSDIPTSTKQYIIRNAMPGKLPLCRLHFEWNQPAGNRVLRFSLATSADLNQWDSLAERLSISRLTHGGTQLENSEVAMPCTRAEYLRLSWDEAPQGVAITRIQGIYPQQAEQVLQWKTLGKPEVRQEQGITEWLFENPGIIPVSKIRLMTASAGNIYTGDVYSHAVPPPGQKVQWQYRGRLNQYLLNLNDAQVQSEAASVTVARDRFWKIRLDGPAATSQEVPEVTVGWHPDTLLFLAQGKAPFTLAFGSLDAASAGFGDLSATLPDIQAQSVSLGEIHPLGNIDPNRQSFPWKMIILWLALISGTLLMGYMAFSLYRQMNRDSGAS